jgi:elongation factor P
MDEESYEQHMASKEVVGEAASWLKEQDSCTVTLWNGTPILVVPANFVNLTVSNTDPGLRGDTASGATKPATVETGATIKVPLFVEEGELIRIDTRTGEYVSRVKE